MSVFCIINNLILLIFCIGGNCGYEMYDVVQYQYKIEKWLDEVDSDLSHFNALSAYLTWQLSINPNDKLIKQAKELALVRNKWKNNECDFNIKKSLLTNEQKRKILLLCRGPKFNDNMVEKYLMNAAKLTAEYNSELCLPRNVPSPLQILSRNGNISSLPSSGDCLYGEPDLENLMKRNDLNLRQLKWTWLFWHNFVGPKIKPYYQKSVVYQNIAAQNNGYQNMGEIWREELEIPNLEETVFDLYQEIKPLYEMLHAVVRHKLFIKYGHLEVNPKGPIRLHLLRNMWGQDWSSLIDLFIPSNKRINLNDKLHKKNWTVHDMVLLAEDYYVSLGLPKMTNKFWKYSIFEENENTTLCHGTAANLYSQDDFRMLLCAQLSMEDFYIIHHEMGHIEYYMAYENQPAIFQEGTNSAFHESIGDAIMHGVMTQQHLHRLGLISDEELTDPSVELFLLLQQALAKIPEIPFALLIDKYRWDVFSGKIKYEDYNEAYWKLNLKLRGIIPPEERDEKYFDIGAKFHIPDNTPYIRYFLSSILQMEIFKSICEISTFGKTLKNNFQEKSIFPLHRCDLYGGKDGGKRLLTMMEKGSSIKWSEALKMLTGKDYISTEAFLDYYRPVYDWLKKYIEMYNVYVGW